MRVSLSNMIYQDGDEDKEKEEEELDERTKDKIKSSHKTSSTPCIFVHPKTEVINISLPQEFGNKALAYTLTLK